MAAWKEVIKTRSCGFHSGSIGSTAEHWASAQGHWGEAAVTLSQIKLHILGETES